MTAPRNPKFVWQDALSASKVKPASVLAVGLVMSLRDNGDGQGFYASVRHVAELTGISVSTVDRAKTHLLRSGWLEQVQKGGSNGTRSWASRYRLTVPVNVADEGQQIPADTPVNVTGEGQQPPVTLTGDVLVDQSLSTRPVVKPVSARDRDRVTFAPLVHINDGGDVDDSDGGVTVLGNRPPMTTAELRAYQRHQWQLAQEGYTGDDAPAFAEASKPKRIQSRSAG